MNEEEEQQKQLQQQDNNNKVSAIEGMLQLKRKMNLDEKATYVNEIEKE